MKKARTIFVAVVSLSLIGSPSSHGQPQTPQGDPAATPQDVLKRIEQVEAKLCPPVAIAGHDIVFHSLADQMELYNVPGVSIAVINDGKIEWAKGYGTRETGVDSSVDINTLFQAASISKSVTALGTLHQVGSGTLDLDSNINDFLVSWQVPENAFTDKQPVTVRYLLCHGAGLNGHALGEYARGEKLPTPLQTLDGLPPSKVGAVRVVMEPGTEFRYSGGGYLVLLQALVDVIGKPFPEIMKESVFDPVGMNRSGYFQERDYRRADNAAVGHNGMGSILEGYWRRVTNLAGGGLWTTPSDLCRYAMEIQKALKGQSTVISRELAEEMLTAQVGSYGLGLILEGEGDCLTFGHGGNISGYNNTFFAYAHKGRGVAVMTNGQRGSALSEEIVRAVAVVYDWLELKPDVITPALLSPEELNKYTGRFVFNNALTANVSVEDGHLKMIGEDGRVFLWYPDADNHFYDLYSGWQLEFIFGEGDQVTGAVIAIAEGMGVKAEKADI
ncbi:MAG: serine hydrolase [Candidatus Zixiibacteriota bacterium]|nr:MAG: serine hydrolase [candidate division Zixibacteria bacterium]